MKKINPDDLCSDEFFSLTAVDIAGHSFRLGNLTLTAVQDEQDGYRSCMKELAVTTERMDRAFEIPMVQVKVEPCSEIGRGNSDAYTLTTDDGSVIVSFGTTNHDDYYPCFHFEYTPVEKAREFAKADLLAYLRGEKS